MTALAALRAWQGRSGHERHNTHPDGRRPFKEWATEIRGCLS
jgi:hypothetical protein